MFQIDQASSPLAEILPNLYWNVTFTSRLVCCQSRILRISRGIQLAFVALDKNMSCTLKEMVAFFPANPFDTHIGDENAFTRVPCAMARGPS
jgi:hypothetical protein